MALKAITQVASPSFQRGKVKKEQRPTLKMNPTWVTSADADFSYSVAVENREKAARSRAAGGSAVTKTLHDKAQAMLFSTDAAGTPSLPLHLRSAFSGAAVLPGAGAAAAVPSSPRCSSPRCSSPRYLQATMASALRTRGGTDEKPDVALMEAAGGDSNLSSKHTMDLSHDPGEQPRRLRRTLSAPRSRAREVITMSGESPRAHDPDCFGPGFGVDAAPAPAALADGSQTARPSTASISTHDKSIPNMRRSQRGAGTFVPGPVLTSVEALAASQSTLITDNGFASDAIRHKGRGLASPMKLRPDAHANPNSESGLATQQRLLEDYHGVASGLAVRDTLLLGRRGKGLCSPAPVRDNRSPFQWD